MRVQIKYMPFLVSTGTETMSNSKLAHCLAIEKKLRFYLTLVSLRELS